MAENMTVRAEVWPLAADELGVWLLSGGDAWRSFAIAADSEPHFEVELLAAGHDMPRPLLLHSTSWRSDGPAVVLTYVAVFDCPALVRDIWPAALPVDPGLLPAVGNPPGHGAADAPVPRYVDVLHHALRHLRFLMDTDAGAAAVLTGHWARHLARLTPVLAGMYGLVALLGPVRS